MARSYEKRTKARKMVDHLWVGYSLEEVALMFKTKERQAVADILASLAVTDAEKLDVLEGYSPQDKVCNCAACGCLLRQRNGQLDHGRKAPLEEVFVRIVDPNTRGFGVPTHARPYCAACADAKQRRAAS